MPSDDFLNRSQKHIIYKFLEIPVFYRCWILKILADSKPQENTTYV